MPETVLQSALEAPEKSRMSPRSILLWCVVALLGAVAWGVLALARGEKISAVWLVVAALGSYAIAYRFYSRFIARRVLKPDDRRATPAERLEDGVDFQPTDKRVLLGHHFAAIAGAGPLVGPVLAAQMGYLPGTLWIVAGVIFAGAVQDMVVLFLSMRRDGTSLGQMARDEIGRAGGAAALVAVFAIMIILLGVLALVVVNALAHSPWGTFSVAMTIPIALFMGVWMHRIRPGRVVEASLIGVALLLLAIAGGSWIQNSSLADVFTLSPTTLVFCLVGYGFVASVLPVWMLLAPRDYLSTFMKIGTIALLAVGVVVAAPVLRADAVSDFATSGAGPVFAGSLFPFLFITIACGALSGFHSLISSGTTPKLLEKESQMRLIGYGGMLTESFVAIMALITAAILNQHLYFVMNAPAAQTGSTAQTAAEYANGLGLSGAPIAPAEITQAAQDVGEKSIVSRTGGAPTLAFGMSQVMHQVFGGESLKAFWYHFAIMFEALFILTTVDAGTRVARFMLSDGLANLGGPLKKLQNPSWRVGAWICSVIVVAAWGGILLMGVTDPLGGINTLFPLFGIANQLLAAIALTVVMVVVVKRGLVKWAWIPAIPLFWDLIVTLTASWQKIFSADPKLGYWKQHSLCEAAQAAGKLCLTAKTSADVDKIVRNTFIQGTLSIVFASVVVIVFVAGIMVVLGSLRGTGKPLTEDEPMPSRIFAPSGLIPTKTEREVQKQWDALPRSQAKSVGTGAH